MDRNLATQGYCLEAGESRSLRVGVRFSTGLCLVLVATGLALQSAPMVAALAVVGVVAGFASRHPFDLVWNHGLRHLSGAPALPPNPARRRHAFKLATVWLLAVAGLLAAGQSTAALVLGGLLVAACTVVTAANLCLPSEALAWRERRNREVTPA
jgi:hypothetical protein